MRKTGDRRVENTTCRITEAVSATKRPPRITSRRSKFIKRHNAPRPVPIASEPVSPIMIFAGAAFHQRKPRHAPDQSHCDQTKVERRMDSVDRVVAELPVPNDRQHPEAERARSGGETVQTVREIHRVRRRHDEKTSQDEPPHHR